MEESHTLALQAPQHVDKFFKEVIGLPVVEYEAEVEYGSFFDALPAWVSLSGAYCSYFGGKNDENKGTDNIIIIETDNCQKENLPEVWEWMECEYKKSYEAFLAARKHLLESKTDTIRESIEEYVDKYLCLYREAADVLADAHNENAGDYTRLFDMLSVIDCVKDSVNNKIYLSKYHPLFLMQYYIIPNYFEEEIINQKQNYSQYSDNEWFLELVERVAVQRYKNDLVEKVQLCYGSNLYHFADGLQLQCGNTRESVWEFKRMHELGTMTKINSLRLIEKIKQAIHNAKDSKTVLVAVFGELSDAQEAERLELEKYIEKNRQTEFQGKEIVIHIFKKDTSVMGDYLFSCQRTHGCKLFCNLNDPDSITKLFRDFSLAIFLDCGCFYRLSREKEQFNCATFEEKYDFVRQYMQYVEAVNTKDKRLYTTLLYYCSKWLSYKGSGNTYSFDEGLYQRITGASKNACEVYAYISQGKYIGDVRLEDVNVCKGEYYDGRKLLVYKFRNTDPLQGINTGKYAGKDEEDKYLIVTNLWRIIKSISTDFLDILIHYFERKQPNQMIDKYEILYYLRNSYLVIDYRKFAVSAEQKRERSADSAALLCSIYEKYSLRKEMISNSWRNLMREMLSHLLNAAFIEKTTNFSEYIRDVFLSAWTSKADTLRSILFTYLLEERRIGISEVKWWDPDENANIEEYCGKKIDFAHNKMLYTLVEALDKRLDRQSELRGYILTTTYKKKYAYAIPDENYKEILTGLHRACEELNYRDTWLYYNAGLLD